MIKPFSFSIVYNKERNRGTMIKEEKILQNRFGKDNHFKVPEGYFEHFTDQLMSQIPEQEAQIVVMQPSFWQRISVRKIAAAVGVAVVLGGGGLFYAHHQSLGLHEVIAATHHDAHQDGNASSTSYGSFDEMADYTMMDNQDIYASLIAEN